MRLYFVKTPKPIKLLFKHWFWSFSFKKKAIYLTFDDGPTPEITNWVLQQLKQYNAKATFFCIGKNVKIHSEIFQKIIEENHSIGNHTNNHFNGWKKNTTSYLENFEKAEKNFNKNFIFKTEATKLFRPPYGKLKLSQAKKIRNKGFKIIMWDVLSADFDTQISKEKCLQNVLNNIENGSIVVFHDSKKATEKLKYVLPKILKYYTERNYKFEKII